MVFLYRHYLELRLKELIHAGRKCLDQPPKLSLGHGLDKLWPSCRKIMDEVWPGSDSGDSGVLDTVQNCIHEFCQIDQKSSSFRYPTDTEGQPSLPGLDYVNVRNLHDVMARISAFLDSASMGISACLDEKKSASQDMQL